MVWDPSVLFSFGFVFVSYVFSGARVSEVSLTRRHKQRAEEMAQWLAPEISFLDRLVTTERLKCANCSR